MFGYGHHKKCEAMCTQIRQEFNRKIAPAHRYLVNQKQGLMEDHRLCLEEWEENARKWQQDGGALDIKLDDAIHVMMEQMNALGVEDLQAEVQHLDQKLQAVTDDVRTLVANCRSHG